MPSNKEDIETLVELLSHTPSYMIALEIIRARNLTLIGELHESPRAAQVIHEIQNHDYVVLEVPEDEQDNIDAYLRGDQSSCGSFSQDYMEILDCAKKHNVKVIAGYMGREGIERTVESDKYLRRVRDEAGYSPIATDPVMVEKVDKNFGRIIHDKIPDYEKKRILVYCGAAHVPGIIKEVFQIGK